MFFGRELCSYGVLCGGGWLVLVENLVVDVWFWFRIVMVVKCGFLFVWSI